MSSSIGKLFRLTTFGESHGLAMGGVIDGCPSGFKIDFKQIQEFLNKRRPGSSVIYSERNESDQVEFMSGILDGVTLGSPIGFIIKNSDQKIKDYSSYRDVFRPSHSDYTYESKYGIRDYKGGGRSSARETVNWVVAGAIATQILSFKKIYIYSYVSAVGDIILDQHYSKLDLNNIYNNNVRCPSQKTAFLMEDLISTCKQKGDTIGGQVSTIIKGLPVGLGEPVFSKLNSGLAKAIIGINACRGIEFGSGFTGSSRKGSEENDQFFVDSNSIKVKTNNSGGIQGGISNGQEVFFKSAFKPVSSIMKKQSTVNNKLQQVNLMPAGRHDPCVVPRAVPIVSALTAIIVLDYYLLSKTTKLSDL
tara:strand:- start:440 stop:1525 length:1086 start_codon:yes stop_codon:yes gene_type:complete